MTRVSHEKGHHHVKRDGFVAVALWQLLAFLMLILLIWVNEILDLSRLWFGTHPSAPNLYRGSVLTIGVFIVAIVAVGNTYLQQKRIISGLLLVCSSCRKIQVDEKAWEHLDDYVVGHSLASISHGLCPVCFDRMKKELDLFDTGQKTVKL
ncbi:MAG: hypothetical protein WCI20_09050 [bacterium]